jgi:hypothetical protein
MWYRLSDFLAAHRNGAMIGVAAIAVAALLGVGVVLFAAANTAPTTTTTTASTTTTRPPEATSIPARTAADVAADPTVSPECRAAAAAAAAPGVAPGPGVSGRDRAEARRDALRAFHAACAGIL